MERVKHEVPVWKEEFYMDGSSQYIEGCCIRKDVETAHMHHHPKHSDETHQHCHHAKENTPFIYQWPI